MPNNDDYAQFVQIAASVVGVYALDASGSVWHYIPANEAKQTFAFWTKLTDHRSDPAKAKRK